MGDDMSFLDIVPVVRLTSHFKGLTLCDNEPLVFLDLDWKGFFQNVIGQVFEVEHISVLGRNADCALLSEDVQVLLILAKFSVGPQTLCHKGEINGP